VPLGTASDLMVGETVIAVGNAYGYEHTVTTGIVSAIKRDVTLNKEISYKSLIQTDASINPGNSGGPLLNVNGEMIGINVAIRAGAQGISFAIPVDSMIRVASELLSVRKRNGLWHGLVCRDRLLLDDELKLQSASDAAVSRPDLHGEPPAWKRELVVERVEPASPAAKAGFQEGDVVVKTGNLDTASVLDLERGLLDHAAGERVPVMVKRKNAAQRLELVLQPVERTASTPADVVWHKLGLRLQPVTGEFVARTSQQLHGGLSVLEVNPNSIAEKSGMQRGDILVGLHQWETLTLDNVAFVLTHPDLATFNPLCFYVIRNGQVRRGWLQQVD
jgi:serine protease Do